MNNMTENSKDGKMPAIKQAGKNKGLGKGLGALLQTIEMPDDQIKDSVMELKITDNNSKLEDLK